MHFLGNRPAKKTLLEALKSDYTQLDKVDKKTKLAGRTAARSDPEGNVRERTVTLAPLHSQTLSSLRHRSDSQGTLRVRQR